MTGESKCQVVCRSSFYWIVMETVMVRAFQDQLTNENFVFWFCVKYFQVLILCLVGKGNKGGFDFYRKKMF